MADIRMPETVPGEWQAAAKAFLPTETRVLAVQRMSGGFSGALVLKIDTDFAVFILRGMSLHETDAEALQRLHRWLAQLHESGLPVAVPIPCRQSGCTTWEHRGRIWQMEPCLSGASLDGDQLSTVQIQNLMQTVAKLHLASASLHQQDPIFTSTGVGVSPSVRSRLNLIHTWTPERIGKAFQSLSDAPLELREQLDACLAAFLRFHEQIRRELESYCHVSVPLHPCFRDLWQSNILFKGDQVTGLIDPHSTRVDHVSSDLSRLLSGYFYDDERKRTAALALYEELRPLSDTERNLIQAMEHSGVVLSGMTWVSRWMNSQISHESREAASMRLQSLTRKLLRFPK